MRRWTAAPDPPSDPAAPPDAGYRDAPVRAPAPPSAPSAVPRRGGDRLVGAILLAALGAAVAFGQPPWGLWWLALPGWAAALWILGRTRMPGLGGWLMGTCHFAVALHWIAEPFLVDAAATGFLAPVAVVATCAGLALFWGVGASLGGRFMGGPLGVAVGIAAAEFARSWVLTGFPWALPGHVLIGSPAFLAASWGGAQALSLAVLVGAGGLATLRVWGMATGAVLWALPFGAASVVSPAPPVAEDAPVVRLVQPNAPQAQKWDPGLVAVFFRRALDLTARPGDVDAVVWPETSMPVLLGESESVRRSMAAAAAAPIVAGAQRYGEDGSPRNALALLEGPDGAVARLYDKHRLVPFGEYMPLPRLAGALGLGPLAAQLAGRYAPGPGPETFDLPGVGRVLPLICYEAIFPQDILRAAPRAEVILHLTNDAWFGAGAGPRQHLALARLRAVEAGLPVLRAANTGISAAIDARGAVLEALPLNVEGALDVRVPPALPPTPYARVGDLPALLMLLALAAGLGARRRIAARPPNR